ncbi:hypothetical protein AB1N83_004555 [Pleurotus pulmonarius]
MAPSLDEYLRRLPAWRLPAPTSADSAFPLCTPSDHTSALPYPPSDVAVCAYEGMICDFSPNSITCIVPVLVSWIWFSAHGYDDVKSAALISPAIKQRPYRYRWIMGATAPFAGRAV